MDFTPEGRRYNASPASLDQVRRSFTYHAPQPDQLPRYQSLRDEAQQLALPVLEMVPPGRCQALALTKLEEAIMWANKGIALEARDGPEGGAA